MFEKNEIKSGLIMGLALPIIGFILGYLIIVGISSPQWLSYEGVAPRFRTRTLFIVAICLNVIPFQVFSKKRFTESMRGTVLATFILGFTWIFLYRDILFGS